MQLSFFDVPAVDLPAETKELIMAVTAGSNGNDHHLDGPALGSDYRITEADPIGVSSQMMKVKGNLAVLKLLRQLEAEGRAATPEEQKQLVLYTGWGHTAQPFHPKAQGKWLELQQEMRPHFTAEQWRAASASTLNAHYTSPEIIRWMWQVVEHLGFAGGKVLEPAAGVGHFLGLMPASIRAKSRLYACELDLLSGAIIKQLYPSAKVYVGGFETGPYENNFFDLAISNVPFANISVHDPVIFHNGRGHLAGTGLHNYFFIKALDLVRPGGLIAFISTRYTLDSQESNVRAYLAGRAHLLGAIRLPVTAFKKNAHTEVTTDVIFLLKHDNREGPALPWVETIAHEGYRLNELYESRPELMLGEMEITGGRFKDACECVPPKLNFDLVRELDRRLYHDAIFPAGIYRPAETRRTLRVEPEKLEDGPTTPWLREGSYYMDDHYRVWQKQGRSWLRARLEGNQLSRVRGLIEVRDAFRAVLEANAIYATDQDLATAQESLATVYRRYISKWGYLHEGANISAFSEDADADNILALERWDPDRQKGTKAAIFTRRLVTPAVRPERAETAGEALAISLRETGRVDFDRMTELTGMVPVQLIRELGDAIFSVYQSNEAGDQVTLEYLPADQYLCGNIRQKLVQAEEWRQENPRFEQNVRALNAVMPRWVGPKEIFAQLGAPWIPEHIVEAFVHQRLFSTDGSYLGKRVRIRYIDRLGYWRLGDDGAGLLKVSAANRQTWGTHRVTALDLVEKCLNGQSATVYDPTGENEKRVVNQPATLAARAKQAEIKAAFEAWVWLDETRSEELVRIYNHKFNSVIPARFNGAHLDLPGLNPAITLREIQQNVIWRGLQSKALMIAHQVGFGKTYSQIGLAMRLKQMGLRQRIMIVVKRATFGQFVQAFKEAYPLANVSMISSGQSGTHRRRQMARIATEDFDVTVTTHPVFSAIPITPETRLRFLREQIDEMEEAILGLDDEISTKEIEKARKRLDKKLEKLLESGPKRDPNTLYYEDLKIDALIVDEANSYKNLWFFTAGSRISGMGGSESGRAYDMFLKIKLLREHGGFVTFATGTPLENSISEVYTMMKFLIPERLQELGLHHFDAWKATFGRVVTGVEMKPDGSGFRVNERFASFNNLPQLKKLWWEVADVQMNAVEAGIVLPRLAGGKPIGIQAEPYPQLKRILLTLANRANNLADVDPHKDNILKIMSDADKASLDARLLGEFKEINAIGQETGEVIHITTDYAGSKVNLCADKVAEIYHRTTAIEIPGQPGRHNLVQLVFLDSSTPNGGKKFSVYEDLREKLIARGIKREEIAFSQDYSDDERKEKLAAALNKGRIRITIGHTETMGIGLNCQRLLAALHHLDCPWKPAWIEQREGRILRQGNLCPEVVIYRYVMAGSFDVYRWQTIERKYSFIIEYNSKDLSHLSVEDPGLAVLSAREMTALATGNPKIIQAVELQTRLRTLKALRQDHEQVRHEARSRRQSSMGAIQALRESIEKRSAFQAVIEAEGQAPAIALGAQLYELCQPHFEVYNQRVEIGELYGGKVFYVGNAVEEEAPNRPAILEVRTFWTGAEGSEPEPPKEVPQKIKVTRLVQFEHENFYDEFKLRIEEDTRSEKNTAALQNSLASVPRDIRDRRAKIAGYEQDLEEIDPILAQSFGEDAEINELEVRLAGLDNEIKMELGDRGEPEQAQAARVDLAAGDDEDDLEIEID